MSIPAKWRDTASLQQQVASQLNPVLQGYAFPRYDTAPDNADGLFYYDTTLSLPAWNNGAEWNYMIGGDSSGNVDIAGTLDVTEATVLDSTLSVAGNTTLSGTLAAGNTAITGTLSTTGTASLNSISSGSIAATGNVTTTASVGAGTASPSTTLDVNADQLRVRTAKTPASASATGTQGTICWDSNYIYVCTATNTWKRAAIATW